LSGVISVEKTFLIALLLFDLLDPFDREEFLLDEFEPELFLRVTFAGRGIFRWFIWVDARSKAFTVISAFGVGVETRRESSSWTSTLMSLSLNSESS
jgi:hypothetical protein